MVAAEELGLGARPRRRARGRHRPQRLRARLGRLDGTPAVMPAVRSAAGKVRRILLSLAADVLEISADDLTLRRRSHPLAGRRARRRRDRGDRQARERDDRRHGHTWPQSGRVPREHVRLPDRAGGGRARARASSAWSGVVAVHDVGRIVNPLAASSQLEGGVIQGVGYALTEDLIVDPTTGVPVNGHLDDYKVPTIADVPEIVWDFVDIPDENLPNLGARRVSASRRSSRPPPRSRSVRPCDGSPRGRAPPDAGPGAGDARMTRTHAPQAWTTRSRSSPATAPRRSAAGRPGRAGRPGHSQPDGGGDLRDGGLGGIEERDGGLRIGATVTLAALAASPLVQPYAAVRARPRSPPLRCSETPGRSAAISASTTRGAGTTAARSGTAGSAGARRATRRSATTAGTTSSRATASPRTRPTWRRRSPRRVPWRRSARRRAAARCRCWSSPVARPRTTARS